MSLLDRIVNITTVRVRATAPTLGFGVPFLLGESLVSFPEIVKSYSSLDDVLVDFTAAMPEYKVARAMFSQETRCTNILIGQKTDATSLINAYNAAKLINPNFYSVHIISDDPDDILDIAAQVETERRIFCFNSSQSGILQNTTGNIFQLIYELGYTRTNGIYGENSATEFSSSAWAGKMLAKPAGSATWAYQNLVGVTGDRLLTSEELNIENNNGNYYKFLASQNVTLVGTMFSGEWIDIVMGLDWLTASLEISLGTLLEQVDKIPYTSRGDGLINNAITSVLQLAVDNGVINDDFKVTFSDLATVPLVDKTARVRNGISINATMTGAIHAINIKLTVTD